MELKINLRAKWANFSWELILIKNWNLEWNIDLKQKTIMIVKELD